MDLKIRGPVYLYVMGAKIKNQRTIIIIIPNYDTAGALATQFEWCNISYYYYYHRHYCNISIFTITTSYYYHDETVVYESSSLLYDHDCHVPTDFWEAPRRRGRLGR